MWLRLENARTIEGLKRMDGEWTLFVGLVGFAVGQQWMEEQDNRTKAIVGGCQVFFLKNKGMGEEEKDMPIWTS